MAGVCMILQTWLQMHQHVCGSAGMVTTARYPLGKTLKCTSSMAKHYLKLQHDGCDMMTVLSSFGISGASLGWAAGSAAISGTEHTHRWVQRLSNMIADNQDYKRINQCAAARPLLHYEWWCDINVVKMWWYVYLVYWGHLVAGGKLYPAAQTQANETSSRSIYSYKMHPLQLFTHCLNYI